MVVKTDDTEYPYLNFTTTAVPHNVNMACH